MAKKSVIQEEEIVNDNYIDTDEITPIENIKVSPAVMFEKEVKIGEDKTVSIETKERNIVSCLRDDIVIVRYVLKPNGFVKNPKNPQYGGLSEGSKIFFTVPRNRNGSLKNPLTNSEKAFLESYMGLEHDALSVYNTSNNYWINRGVLCDKTDKILRLSDPIDYIDYKILLANSDLIAPSLEDLQEVKKGTWRYVLIREGEENKIRKSKINQTQEAWKAFGSIENDKTKLKVIIQLLRGGFIAKDTKLDTLQFWLQEEINKDPKMVTTTIKDPNLDTKILLFEAVELNVIKKQGQFYYTLENLPLCEKGKDPVMKEVIDYLNSPMHQIERLSIEAKVKTARE